MTGANSSSASARNESARPRVFVSEWITGGAVDVGRCPTSLVREGDAMLQAVVADLLESYAVLTTRAARLPPLPPHRYLQVTTVHGSSHQPSARENVYDEQPCFRDMCRQSDAFLIIAPEFDGLLQRQTELALAATDGLASNLGCAPAAIALCADKLRTAQFLNGIDVPTIPTQSAECPVPPEWFDRALISKPRDGAGSQEITRHNSVDCWRQFVQARGTHAPQGQAVDCSHLQQLVLQPEMYGQPASVGVLVHNRTQLTLLPVALQKIDRRRGFEYLGGQVPLQVSDRIQSEIERIVTSIVQSLPGLGGYVGLDLLIDEQMGQVTVVEINPRLCTSYIGYRKITDRNLATCWVSGRLGTDAALSAQKIRRIAVLPVGPLEFSPFAPLTNQATANEATA